MDDRKDEHRVLLDPLIYAKVKGIAHIKGVTTEEWVNESLRRAVIDAPEAMEATSRVLSYDTGFDTVSGIERLE